MRETPAPGAPAADDLEDVPGFDHPAAPLDLLDEDPLRDLPPSPPGAPGPSTTSTPPPPPPPGPTHPGPSTPPSTRTSTELPAEVDEALVDLGAGAFHAAGALLNRLARRRTHSDTRAWLATEEEADAIGAAIGRIAARRIPEELAGEGDPSDLLILGTVGAQYAIRNAMGVTDEDLARAAGGVPPRVAETPPPAPPAAPRTVTTVVTAQQAPPAEEPPPGPSGGVLPQHFDTDAATPPPPSVISPDI